MADDENRQSPVRWIAIAAHELKAPIAAIEGYLRIVREQSAGDNPELYQEMIDRCLIRAGEMRNLIGDFLDAGRLENGQIRRDVTRVSLAESARYILESLDPLIRDRKITVNLNVSDDPSLLADRQDIDVIFRNLLSNAVKYNIDGGTIDVSIAAQHEAVTVRVADTGIGIAPDELDRLFKEFGRIKNEKTRTIPGSGLGLWIVKKLTEHYNGSITLQSVPGRGTQVIITWPGADQSSEKER